MCHSSISALQIPLPSAAERIHFPPNSLGMKRSAEDLPQRQGKGKSGSKCPFTKGLGPANYREGRKDGPVRCSWYPGINASQRDAFHPRYKEEEAEAEGHDDDARASAQKSGIAENVLQLIGDTPMVRINKIAREEGLECDLVAKCEFYNAGGSVKDRIALRMIEDAEREGRIKQGDTLIEPTSGNTGIGLALASAIKGYRCIITLPEKMSNEKVNILKALGAEIIRTPTEAAFDSAESHIGVARRLQEEIPHSHILDQYKNPSNPLAHYDATAEEILEQCDGKVDVVVMGAGTGGTLTGIGRKLRERLPNVKIVAVDPRGSILAEPDHLNEQSKLQPYKVEGTGYDFIPTVLDRSIVDMWVKTDDRDSFIMSRRLIREEGLLCGGSSGAAVHGAVTACRELGLVKGQRCVVLLPDSVRNYMTKFVSDEWMFEHDLIDANNVRDNVSNSWWAPRKVSELTLQTPLTIGPNVSCKEAISLLSSQGYDMVPVVSKEDNKVLGVVTEGALSSNLVAQRVSPSDACTQVMYRQFKKVTLQTPLSELARAFNSDHFALVITEQRCYTNGNHSTLSVIAGVVTRIDLLNYIAAGENHARA